MRNPIVNNFDDLRKICDSKNISQIAKICEDWNTYIDICICDSVERFTDCSMGRYVDAKLDELINLFHSISFNIFFNKDTAKWVYDIPRFIDVINHIEQRSNELSEIYE